jgi:formylglycine-generating enzyme required for sulfatase activity
MTTPLLVMLACSAAFAAPPEGMVWIESKEFTMGSMNADAPMTERPAHHVRVDGFWIDVTEVTNAQFKAFVDATGYVTQAERPVDWEELKKQVPPGTPKPADEMLRPGSMVFKPPPPDTRVNINNVEQWWAWTIGADWKHPEGPDSSIGDRMDHPVVQVGFDDAVAYAKWAKKRLPTEAEWELAARGGLSAKKYTWGDEPASETDPKCNIWQGDFPTRNTLKDGYLRTSPVRAFPANGYGLFGMAGNVWEWCSDFFRADAYKQYVGDAKVVVNPRGPGDSWDPNETIPGTPKHVIRGGSFLCHITYCESYRPAARRGLTPDTGMSHTGFRCVRDKSAADAAK